MGAFLNNPKTEKDAHTGEGNGIKYGVSAMQGWRKEMEDAHVCFPVYFEDLSIFGVFDGHAGSKAAKYSSTDLPQYMCGKKLSLNEKDIEKNIKAAFINFDKMLMKHCSSDNPKVPEDRSGTTAIVTLITLNKIIFANCGDSRGIMCKNGEVFFATTDHKPFNEIERNRIEKAGGTVMMQRVNGSLAVSRALGDFDFKKSPEVGPCDQLVSPEPEITILERDEKNDQFLILACDGIFDVISNEEVVAFVLRKLEYMEDLSQICSDLIDMCLNKNSRDNMSAILITFCNTPKVTKDGIEKNEQLQRKARESITSAVAEIVTFCDDVLDLEFNTVLKKLGLMLPTEYDVYSNANKDMITALLDDHRKERFGNIESDFNSECSDPSNAPSYMLGDDDDQFDSLPFPPSSQHDNVSTAGSNPPEYSDMEPTVTSTTTNQPQTSSLPESNIPTCMAGSNPPS